MFVKKTFAVASSFEKDKNFLEKKNILLVSESECFCFSYCFIKHSNSSLDKFPPPVQIWLTIAFKNIFI